MSDMILTGVMNGERVLEDDYPIYGGYLYIVDERVIVSDYHEITVKKFKQLMNAKEIRNCNMGERNLF